MEEDGDSAEVGQFDVTQQTQNFREMAMNSMEEPPRLMEINEGDGTQIIA